jgi:hypothetical protein
MLTKTNYTVDTTLFQEACMNLPSQVMKTAINSPTGNFFYDPWILKDEFKGTVWETLYDSLPTPKGESRIIILDPGQSYQSHADIDDRYHLNISGDKCFLIDLVREQMHKLSSDGIWYDMNAGFHHTATNFGRTSRIQLVVRKLLKRGNLINPVQLKITSKNYTNDHSRFIFDNVLSPWLNGINKQGQMDDLMFDGSTVSFKLENTELDQLMEKAGDDFLITVS